MKKFFSSEREVKSYSPLDSQISSADFSLVINFPHKIFVPSKPATLQLSKMVWHLKIGQKLRVLGAKTWGVMFFQNFWLKLKGAILGPQNHFWWFQRQNGGFPNGYFGFLKKKLKSESAILRLPNSCSNIGWISAFRTNILSTTPSSSSPVRTPSQLSATKTLFATPGPGTTPKPAVKVKPILQVKPSEIKKDNSAKDQ